MNNDSIWRSNNNNETKIGVEMFKILNGLMKILIIIFFLNKS